MTTTCGPEGTEFQLFPNGCYSEPELTMYRQSTKRTAKLGKKYCLQSENFILCLTDLTKKGYNFPNIIFMTKDMEF